ncbi:uncharacterized protein [Diabrotica undecimpunctata]|uniref:uncharacterized protein n=1 Tax=Diabrotica undecimpunctata TaxID=50387 RepID=UPI003B63E1CB
MGEEATTIFMIKCEDAVGYIRSKILKKDIPRVPLGPEEASLILNLQSIQKSNQSIQKSKAKHPRTSRTPEHLELKPEHPRASRNQSKASQNIQNSRASRNHTRASQSIQNLQNYICKKMKTLILIAYLIYASHGNNQLIDIKEIEPSPGIYYDHVAHVNFYESSWKLVTYLNLDSFKNKLKLIDSNLRKTKEICMHNSLNSLSLCNTSLLVIEQLAPAIHEKDKVLQDLAHTTRVKRGIIDGIGTVFKTLFGTLDHNDAEYYDAAINKVESNDKHLITLLKDQIQIVQTTISNFNSSITNVERNNNIFDKNFRTIQKLTQDNSKNIFQLNLKQVIDEHLSLITLLISEVNNEYSNIINAILFSKTNQLHPIILSPQQYLLELTKTLPQIPPSTAYPLPLEKQNILELLSLVDVQHYFSDTKVIFIVKMPLVSQLPFQLFKLIPLPTVNNALQHVFILPRFNYLAISESKSTYSNLDNLDACKKLSTEDLICIHHYPIYSTYSRASCETDMLFSPTKIPYSCDIRISQFYTDTWYPLLKRNTWLFILPKPISVTVQCKNNRPEDHMISRTGILTLNADCKVYTSSTILSSYKSTSFQSVTKSVLPTINILQDDCCNSSIKFNLTTLYVSPSHIFTLDRENLNIASHKLEVLKNTINEVEQEANSPIQILHNSYFLYFLLTLIKIFGIYLLYRLYRYCKKHHKHSHDTGCISNCITFNYCKEIKNSRQESLPLSFELTSNPSTSNNGTITISPKLRRSDRIASLKTNTD